MVALQHQRVAARERRLDVRGGGAEVGEHAEAVRAVGEHELHRLARVVRHGEGQHLDGADGESRAPLDDARQHAVHCLARLIQRAGRAVRHPDAGAELRGKAERMARMIVVLVSDQDARDVGGRKAQAREALLGLARREAAVDQDTGGADFGNEAVALAAAAQRGETNQRLTSAARAAGR